VHLFHPSSIIRIVRLNIKAEKVNEFINTFELIRSVIAATPGCIELELWNDADNENVFYTYSIWDDPQALENYRNSALFKDNWSTVKPLFAERAKAWSARRCIIKAE